MAGHTLRRARMSKRQISNKSPNSDSQHDPAVVCHEQKPKTISCGPQSKQGFLLHDEEAIENLDRIQTRLDELDFRLCLLSILS